MALPENELMHCCRRQVPNTSFPQSVNAVLQRSQCPTPKAIRVKHCAFLSRISTGWKPELRVAPNGVRQSKQENARAPPSRREMDAQSNTPSTPSIQKRGAGHWWPYSPFDGIARSTCVTYADLRRRNLAPNRPSKPVPTNPIVAGSGTTFPGVELPKVTSSNPI